jgi:hypothetical protein
MVAMGSLLSEGNHLYLDRSLDWRGALRLILQEARKVEDAAGAAAVVLRDLPDGDDELHAFLLGEGLIRVPVWDTWVREIDFADDEEFLAQLTSKHRAHQRRNVLPWEAAYRVHALEGGSEEAMALPRGQKDALYGMYRAVHARAFDLNVFPLPQRVIDAVLASPDWEVLLLSLVDHPDVPVAFIVQHIAADHVTPVFCGLDYAYVKTHHSYQQLLFQVIRSAQRQGKKRVFYGMSADLQKRRFGARAHKHWAYVQATETYNSDVLAHLTESVPTA